MARLAVRLRKKGVGDMMDVGREMMSSKCLGTTDANISWLLAWSGLAPLGTQLLQWIRQTVSQFYLYVRDLVTFCTTKTEVGQGVLEMAVKDAYGKGGAG